MKRKNLDTMREIRLWTRDLVIPAGVALVVLMSNPATKKTLVDIKDAGCKKTKTTVKKFKEVFKKEEEA